MYQPNKILYETENPDDCLNIFNSIFSVLFQNSIALLKNLSNRAGPQGHFYTVPTFLCERSQVIKEQKVWMVKKKTTGRNEV